MKRIIGLAATLLVGLAGMTAGALGQTVDPAPEAAPKAAPAADARVRLALQEAKLKFEVNPQGNFRLDFQFEDKRSHVVFVRSGTQTWAGLEVREVVAYAYKGASRPAPETFERLLKDNARKKLGAWELWDEGGVYDLVFSVKIPAVCDADALQAVVRGVAVTADEMEKALGGGDEL